MSNRFCLLVAEQIGLVVHVCDAYPEIFGNQH